jgi:cell fate (sporulation/competence/biofilm development) regulator YlbF (YheA/YmcA/DUF963 family)
MENSLVLEKTKDLCQTILEDPSVRKIRQRIDAFMADDGARQQYDGVLAKGQALQEKQQSSALNGDEVADFEAERDQLLDNPVARGFLDAQEELRDLQQTVQKYINKTLELGRIPTEDDLTSGCCEGGCSCGH